MPFIHYNYCANPIGCRNADKKIWKIRYKANDSAYIFSHDKNYHIAYSQVKYWW